MKRESFFLKVLSPLHVGAGQGLSHIDLPIVREVHTDFPYVPASSIKGVVREHYIRKVSGQTGMSVADLDKWLSEGNLPADRDFDNEFKKQFYWLKAVFGSQDNAGQVYFTDARLLLFPVKSLKGVFQLITCPYAVNRYLEDMDMNGIGLEVEEDGALTFSDEFTVDGKLMLEEFVFSAKKSDELRNFAQNLPVDDELKKRVVCLSDSIFSDMVKSYTEVQTHIKIDPDTGTVSGTALFTTEYLPAESLLYLNLFCDKGDITLTLPETLHIGGDITTGKGFVRVIKGGQK